MTIELCISNIKNFLIYDQISIMYRKFIDILTPCDVFADWVQDVIMNYLAFDNVNRLVDA